MTVILWGIFALIFIFAWWSDHRHRRRKFDRDYRAWKEEQDYEAWKKERGM